MKAIATLLAALLALPACQSQNDPIAPEIPQQSRAGIDVSTNLFARVDMAGGLIFGNGVLGVSKLGTGRYEVTFNRDMRRCAYVATTFNSYSQAIQVFTASGHTSINGVYLETKNQGGGLTDGPFDLVAACDGTMRFAVVDRGQNLVRATPGTISLGGGLIMFHDPVDNCAFLATVADPGNGTVLSPGNVSTGSFFFSSRIVHVETKNPAGGILPGYPYHLVVICPTATTGFAVVSSNGRLARGTAKVQSARHSTGNYEVGFNTSILRCAVIATRGSVDTLVAFNPATVEITPGSSVASTGLQVRELLALGGNLTNESFHVATVC